MASDRAAGRLTVTLPIEWQDGLAFDECGRLVGIAGLRWNCTDQWYGLAWPTFGKQVDCGTFPSEAWAREAVMRALGADASATGAEGGGDAG